MTERDTPLPIALLEGGRPDLAEPQLRELLAKQPLEGALYAMLAESLVQQGKSSAALEAARQALRLAPDFCASHAAMAKALAVAGRIRDALPEALAAVAHDPLDPAHQAQLAAVYVDLRCPRDAERAARAGLALRPTDLDCLGQLGAALIDLGRLAEARDVLAAALAAHPEAPALHYALGLALLLAGERLDATDELAEAARLDPSSERARRLLRAADRAGASNPFISLRRWVGIRWPLQVSLVAVLLALSPAWPGFLVVAAVLGSLALAFAVPPRGEAVRVWIRLGIPMVSLLASPIAYGSPGLWADGAGIGSLFVASIAFGRPTLVRPFAWIILIASLVAGAVAHLWLPPLELTANVEILAVGFLCLTLANIREQYWYE
jgi:tetratricopeptide (TPR) repeat protein